MTTHEVLVAARNMVQKGWWHSPDGCREGHVCAGIAIMDAAPSHEVFGFEREAYRTLASILGLDIACGAGIDILPIYQWNDAPGRTVEEVLAAFDKAIAATSPPPPDPSLPELVEAEAVE